MLKGLRRISTNKIQSFAAIFLVASACHHQVQQSRNANAPAVIEDVRVTGNRRIPTETIKANIQTNPGDQFNEVKTKRDVERLRSLGYFDDVRLTNETGPNGGRVLTFAVREKPH